MAKEVTIAAEDDPVPPEDAAEDADASKPASSDTRATKAQRKDVNFQLKFWQKVHADALETKHPRLIKDAGR